MAQHQASPRPIAENRSTPQEVPSDLQSALTTDTSQPVATKGRLKAECRITLAFLERAHKHSVEVARRLGINEALLSNLTPHAPTDVRLDSLATIRETLLGAKNGHTGSFPDFIGMADSVTRYYREELEKVRGSRSHGDRPSFGFASPTNTLNTCAEMLFVALSLSSNQEQRGACLVLLNLLISKTRDVMPTFSADASTALSESLNFESNRPHTHRK